MVISFALPRRVCHVCFRPTESMKSIAYRERRGPLIQDVQISAIAEDTTAAPPRHLIDHAQPLKVGERRIDRRRCQSSSLHQRRWSGKWILLKQVMDPQRRSSPFALDCDPLPIALEQLGDSRCRVESLICGLGDTDEEKLKPSFPRAVFAPPARGDSSPPDEFSGRD